MNAIGDGLDRALIDVKRNIFAVCMLIEEAFQATVIVPEDGVCHLCQHQFYALLQCANRCTVSSISIHLDVAIMSVSRRQWNNGINTHTGKDKLDISSTALVEISPWA